MSFDLTIFDRAKAPNNSNAFWEWFNAQTQWDAARDYNSLDGTTPSLSAWFMEMKETFPPLNGEYSLDDEAFTDKDIENHLTDYSIGCDMIYAAFGWSVAEEAQKHARMLARKHGLGFYDPQTGEICCDGMAMCKMRTESGEGDKIVDWPQIESAILSIDNPARGTTGRTTAFVTMWFAQNDADEQFMQCAPNYPKPQGFLKKLFGASKTAPPAIESYTVEASTGDKIYAKEVASKEELAQILQSYYKDRQLPNMADWVDNGIL